MALPRYIVHQCRLGCRRTPLSWCTSLQQHTPRRHIVDPEHIGHYSCSGLQHYYSDLRYTCLPRILHSMCTGRRRCAYCNSVRRRNQYRFRNRDLLRRCRWLSRSVYARYNLRRWCIRLNSRVRICRVSCCKSVLQDTTRRSRNSYLR